MGPTERPGPPGPHQQPLRVVRPNALPHRHVKMAQSARGTTPKSSSAFGHSVTSRLADSVNVITEVYTHCPTPDNRASCRGYTEKTCVFGGYPHIHTERREVKAGGTETRARYDKNKRVSNTNDVRSITLHVRLSCPAVRAMLQATAPKPEPFERLAPASRRRAKQRADDSSAVQVPESSRRRKITTSACKIASRARSASLGSTANGQRQAPTKAAARAPRKNRGAQTSAAPFPSRHVGSLGDDPSRRRRSRNRS